jgi:hypothetical protein
LVGSVLVVEMETKEESRIYDADQLGNREKWYRVMGGGGKKTKAYGTVALACMTVQSKHVHDR